MKILIISNYFPPHFKGGYELSCQEVTNYLFEQGEEIFVLCGEYQQDKPSSAPYPVRRKLQYINYLGKDYWQKSRVEKYNYGVTMQVIDEFQPDFVYFWNQQYISLAPYWAVSKRKLQHLFDIGDIWPLKYYREDLKGKVKSYIKRLLPFFLEAKMVIDPVIILSEWMKPLFQEKFFSKRIYTIPRGVKVQETTRHFSNSESIRLMFAGRVEPQKGLDLIIRVLAQLTDLKWSLDIYGDGEVGYLAEIDRSIKNNHLTKRIKLHGMVYPLDKEYENHDVFLFPTLAQEGFGRVAIEAMSFGLPVLTVNEYGPNDIVDHGYNGFKCVIDDVSCWRNNLKRLLTDRELLAEMSMNAVTTVKEKYDINLINKQRYDLIKKIYNSK